MTNRNLASSFLLQAATKVLLPFLLMACGHYSGEVAFLWPQLAELLAQSSAPTCSPAPCRSIMLRGELLGLSGDVANYPLLVRLDTSTFPDIATRTASGGADLRFANAIGVSLPYEIEQWTDNTSGAVWILVDSVSYSSPTQVQMYYDDPIAVSQSDSTAVFSSGNGFEGVWHMHSAAITDATGNGHNGTNIGTTDTTGLIGQARDFDNTISAAVQIAGRLGEPPSTTLSAWVNLTDLDPDASGGAEGISIGDGLVLRVADPAFGGAFGGTYYFGVLTWHPIGGPPVLGNGWKYLSYVVEVGNQRLYLDGVEQSNSTFSDAIWYAGADPDTFLGRHGHGGTNLDFGGQMDEVRISRTVRSADWVKLDFASQRPGSTLLSIGP